MVIPPILDNKHTLMPSVFVPTALLREARQLLPAAGARSRPGNGLRARIRLRPEHVAVRGSRVRKDFMTVVFDHVGARGSIRACPATRTTSWKSAMNSA
jgi:hypothetical protein